jgi:hypothetical protein
VKPKKRRERKQQMVACIQKQHYSEDMKIKDGQRMQVKLIMQKEACSEFVAY